MTTAVPSVTGTGTIPIKFSVTNDGPDPAALAYLSLSLRSDAKASVTTTAGQCTSPNDIGATPGFACRLGTLAAGATAQVTLTLTGTNEESDVLAHAATQAKYVLDRDLSQNDAKVHYTFVPNVICSTGGTEPTLADCPEPPRPQIHISSARATPSRFAVAGTPRSHAAHHPPVGTKLRFVLSHAARVSISLSAIRTGHRGHAGGRCHSTQHHGPACRLVVALGSLPSVKGASGANAVAFSGRLHGSALKPGNYRATITATAAGLEPSSPRYVTFTVAPR